MEKLKCVEITNTHPDKLNEDGKRDLGMEIIEEMPFEELDKFLGSWGYKK